MHEAQFTLDTPAAAHRRRIAAWYVLSGVRCLWDVFTTLMLMFLIVLLLLSASAEDPRKNLLKTLAYIDTIKPPKLADHLNAALDYEAAKKAYLAYPGAKTGSGIPEADTAKRITDWTTIETFLQQNARTLELLEAAAGKQANFNFDYSTAFSMPQLSLLRKAARLWAVQARWLAHQGRHQDAARCVERIRIAAQHAFSDQTLTTNLLAVVVHSIGDGVIQEILLWETPAAATDVAAYRKALRRDLRGDIAAAVKGERVISLRMLDVIFAQQVQQNPSAVMALYGGERRCMTAVFDEYIQELSDERVRTWLGSSDDLDRRMELLIHKHRVTTSVLTDLMVPANLRTAASIADSQERGAVWEIGLACLQFHCTHKRYPAKLSELVPEFLPQLPASAYGDDAFRILVQAKRAPPKGRKFVPEEILAAGAVRVYSLGRDGQDDGGDGSAYEDQDGSDLSIVLPAVPGGGRKP